MRFFLDHDVSARVGTFLRAAGHTAWTAAEAGLGQVSDDTLTVYAAEHTAVLLTHDREFSQRRRRNVVGQHVWLRCAELDAPNLLQHHLTELVQQLEMANDLFVVVSQHGMETSRTWQ